MKAELVPMADGPWVFGVVGEDLPCTPVTAEVDRLTGTVKLRLVEPEESWGAKPDAA